MAKANNSLTWILWPILGIGLLLVVRALFLDGDALTRVGSRVYTGYCASCHGENGEGFKEIIPPLAGADFLTKQENIDQLPCLVIHGMQGEIRVNDIVYNQPMAGIGEGKLSPSEIEGIIKYIQTSWGNTNPYLNRQEVVAATKACASKPLGAE